MSENNEENDVTVSMGWSNGTGTVPSNGEKRGVGFIVSIVSETVFKAMLISFSFKVESYRTARTISKANVRSGNAVKMEKNKKIPTVGTIIINSEIITLTWLHNRKYHNQLAKKRLQQK
jgi:hypothetical protein